MEQRQAKLIDLNEWERSGGGGTGWSYINRNDSSIMLKLNKKEIMGIADVLVRKFN